MKARTAGALWHGWYYQGAIAVVIAKVNPDHGHARKAL
jgi:hypothetical protein